MAFRSENHIPVASCCIASRLLPSRRALERRRVADATSQLFFVACLMMQDLVSLSDHVAPSSEVQRPPANSGCLPTSNFPLLTHFPALRLSCWIQHRSVIRLLPHLISTTLIHCATSAALSGDTNLFAASLPLSILQQTKANKEDKIQALIAASSILRRPSRVFVVLVAFGIWRAKRAS
jgi:hypothetical protein